MATPRALFVGLACLGSFGCPPAAPVIEPTPTASVTPPPAPDPLEIPDPDRTFAGIPEVRARVSGSPFGFFRFVNDAFVHVVCERYRAELDAMPTVNLHGDAHLEQYAVAADGRGLADFDAATLGPPIVDLARFATSLQLAAENDAAAERAIAAFLAAYDGALVDPEATGPEPRVAARMRQRFSATSLAWLDKVDRLIQPVSADKWRRITETREQYVAQMLQQNPNLDASFFQIKRAGALTMGVGSAHEEKFLGRVEGPSPAPDDDVILEMKEMRPVPSGSCLRGPERDPKRVVIGQARLAMSPQRFLGYVSHDGETFYVHEWRVHYTELDVQDLQGVDDLVEVASDVGLQLGKGHPKQLADPRGKELRASLREMLRAVGPTLPPLARELAQRTQRAQLKLSSRAPVR